MEARQDVVMNNTEVLTRKRRELIFDRLWLCGEVRNCERCPVMYECRQLFDNFDAQVYLSPERAEDFLERFQELLAGMASKNNATGY